MTAKPNFDEGTCSGCEKAVLWAMTESGAPMPLEPQPITVMRWTGEGHNVEAIRVFVSHFAKCPRAAEHRRGK